MSGANRARRGGGADNLEAANKAFTARFKRLLYGYYAVGAISVVGASFFPEAAEGAIRALFWIPTVAGLSPISTMPSLMVIAALLFAIPLGVVHMVASEPVGERLRWGLKTQAAHVRVCVPHRRSSAATACLSGLRIALARDSNPRDVTQYHVEQLKTSDARTLLDSKVQDLVSAMAAFAPPASARRRCRPATRRRCCRSSAPTGGPERKWSGDPERVKAGGAGCSPRPRRGHAAGREGDR
ncbi:MAG: hypothetical protein ABI699_06625 [Caldimonas sp.]